MTFAVVVAIRVHGPFTAGPRSILKPASFVELSDQTRLIPLADTAVAERELGAAGGLAGVGRGVGVRVGVAVGGTGVGVRVGVAVGAMGVAVAVRGPAVGVRVGVGVDVLVGVAVRGPAVGVRVGVAVGAIGVAVAVAVGVSGPNVLADAMFA